MIYIKPQPEPASFDATVRQPGIRFLSTIPTKPTSQEWQDKDYWRKSLPALRSVYNETCAFCARRIAHSTGMGSVDHFDSKDEFPQSAYEWKNFRYASLRFNGRKRNERIIDPFEINGDWFQIDFTTMIIRPNPFLDNDLKVKIQNTIVVLKLNEDEDLVKERLQAFRDLQENEISFDYLSREFPFIAQEMQRQGIVSAVAK